ncbi:hypothetical protein F5X99DRAFT_394696 [Biscogniauxia marginata]|nr:hypothetical protein F5X99DRAFT_394696 [Biscogniauxia marginata]
MLQCPTPLVSSFGVVLSLSIASKGKDVFGNGGYPIAYSGFTGIPPYVLLLTRYPGLPSSFSHTLVLVADHTPQSLYLRTGQPLFYC